MPFTYWLNLHYSTMNEDTHGVFKNVQYYPEMSNVMSRPFLSKKNHPTRLTGHMWHRFMSNVLRFPLIIFIIHSNSSFIYLHRSAPWMHVHFMIAYADRRTKLSVNSFLIKWILHLWWINWITCYCIPTSWIWVLYEPLFLLSTTQLCTTRNAAWKYHLLVDTRWKHSACKV